MQKTLIGIGICFVVVGLLWPLLVSLKIGKLPGDIAIEKENFKFYFPITTSIIISLILSAIVYFIRK